jgi:hypothetical protein
MTTLPLSHHDVLELIEPFARRGHHVDLGASNRLERRLVFKPSEVSQALQLEGSGTDFWRLTRTCTNAAGLKATLRASGSQPGELLARIEAFPAERHFREGPDWLVARSYECDAANDVQLMQGVVQVDGLQLKLTVPASRRLSADVELVAHGLDLPEDLLAVLGWNWARLVRGRTHWTSKLRLGRGERSHRAEAALDRAGAHLALTLSQPPGRYQERLRAARWGVVFRRSIPLLMAVALVAAALGLPHFDTSDRPWLWMALYHVPTALIALSFCLQDLARFEIPPWPRGSAAPDWRMR